MSELMAHLQEELGGDFDFVRPLGQGSVARVFLAREKALDRPVAVKVLRRSLALDETARRRFVREAKLSAKINHPNVVSVYRVGELGSDGRPYLVMEYIDGRTLADVLAASGPLPEDEVRRLLVETCKALEAAHRLDIIHRDVRPGNIMRTRDGGRIVLADFGLAGILETGSEAVTRLTKAGEILGDVRYAPPEQLQGEPIQPSSDIYALAISAYELLTGTDPFPDAKDAARVIEAHVKGEPTPLGRLRPGSSPDLEDALLRCLAKNPEQRPSAERLRRKIEIRGGEEGAGPAEGAVDSFLAELKRRHVYKVGVGYGAVLIFVVVSIQDALGALPFDLPEWTATAIVTTMLVGLPVALILAWFYDLTASGVKRTASMGPDAPAGVRALQAIALAATLAIAALIGWLVLGVG